MAFDAKKWLPFGFRILMSLPEAISTVETVVKVFKGAPQNGESKEDAAVDLIKVSLGVTENLADKDLLNDPAVEVAVRNAIRAIVNVQNVVAAVKAAKVKQ